MWQVVRGAQVAVQAADLPYYWRAVFRAQTFFRLRKMSLDFPWAARLFSQEAKVAAAFEREVMSLLAAQQPEREALKKAGVLAVLPE